MRIAVVGTGYVGLVTGTCLAEVGHDVVCVDLDAAKIAKLNDGIAPIFEPGLEDMIRRNAQHERLAFTTDLETALVGTQAVFIAVGTPEGEDGSADLRYVHAVARSIGQKAQADLLVVVKSTVPVGTCDSVEAILVEELRMRRVSFETIVASNPEFLKEGAAIDDFMRPDRIIVGLRGGAGTELFQDIYRPFILDDPGKLYIMDRRSSELTKYGANAMLATRISFMNELARLCEIVGADVDNVRRGMGADPRIGRKFLYAGPGYGGSCFPKDVEALLRSGRQHGVELSVLEKVSETNEHQMQFAAAKVSRHFGSLKGRKIGVWGLAFKPGTDDVRESPAKTIVEQLIAGGATVLCHDPQASANFRRECPESASVRYVKEAYDALDGADAVVLVTEWSEYKRPNWDKAARLMRTKVVFDFRNQYHFAAMQARGFHYECIGRPDSRTSRGQ